MSSKDESDGKLCYMPIPAGTPYSVIAEATNKFSVELSERDLMTPENADGTMTPKAWILRGEKEKLLKAKEFIISRMNEMLERFR